MIRIEGDKQAAQDLRRAANVYRRESESVLREIGAYTAGRAKAYTMDAGAVDLGELVQGIHYELHHNALEQSVTVRPSDTADNYAIYVERGTRPHFPPIDALRGWADRHGIPVWAVATKIAREGTEPRHMWRDTFRDLEQRVGRYVDRFAIELERNI